VPAKNGGDGVGLRRKGKGTKWMLVVDGHGLPLGFHLASAQRAVVRLAEQTLASIRVPRTRGRPQQHPAQLIANRGYDSARFRQALRRRGMAMCIPPKRRPTSWRMKRGRPVLARKDDYVQRYTVERTFAWLGTYRRLPIRWERLFTVYRAWFTVALLRLCVRRFVQLNAQQSEREVRRDGGEEICAALP
jgi:transposase